MSNREQGTHVLSELLDELNRWGAARRQIDLRDAEALDRCQREVAPLVGQRMAELGIEVPV